MVRDVASRGVFLKMGASSGVGILVPVGAAAALLVWAVSSRAGFVVAGLVLAGLLPTLLLAWIVTGERMVDPRVSRYFRSRSIGFGLFEIILGVEGLIGWEAFFGLIHPPYAWLRFYVLFLPSTFLMLDGFRRIVVSVFKLEKLDS